MICNICSKPLDYSGRGQYPKYCPQPAPCRREAEFAKHREVRANSPFAIARRMRQESMVRISGAA